MYSFKTETFRKILLISGKSFVNVTLTEFYFMAELLKCLILKIKKRRENETAPWNVSTKEILLYIGNIYFNFSKNSVAKNLITVQ